jgi:hypothetical protein
LANLLAQCGQQAERVDHAGNVAEQAAGLRAGCNLALQRVELRQQRRLCPGNIALAQGKLISKLPFARAKKHIRGAALALQHMHQLADFAYQFTALQQITQAVQFTLA